MTSASRNRGREQALVTDTVLARAVERFARATRGFPDADLAKEWSWREYDEGLRVAFFRTYEELRELAVILAAERAARGAPPTQAQRVLTQYHLAHRDLDAVLLAADDAALDREPAEGEWALREVIQHMVRADVGFRSVVRFGLGSARAGEAPVRLPEEEWLASVRPDQVAAEAALSGSLADIIAYHGGLHASILQEFATITDEELAAPSYFWESELMPLRFRLHRFDAHLRQHTIQAEKTLEMIGRPATEALRLLRLIYAALAEVEGALIGAEAVLAPRLEDTAALIAARAEEMVAL